MARGLRSLRNVDYRDIEVLGLIDDNCDADGWITTAELQEVIRINHPDGDAVTDKERARYAHQCIATRFSWMVRFKAVERDEKKTKWRLTPLGQEVRKGQLSTAVQKQLAKVSKADQILVMRILTDTYRPKDPRSTFLRREFMAGTQNGGR